MSYTLMRRSNIATETGRGHDALLLAEAALHPRPLTPGLRAAALRQKAAALALLDEEAGYRQAVDDGLDAAGRHDTSPLTVYCTVPYMKMEAGAAAMNLRQPRLAAPAPCRRPAGLAYRSRPGPGSLSGTPCRGPCRDGRPGPGMRRRTTGFAGGALRPIEAHRRQPSGTPGGAHPVPSPA